MDAPGKKEEKPIIIDCVEKHYTMFQTMKNILTHNLRSMLRSSGSFNFLSPQHPFIHLTVGVRKVNGPNPPITKTLNKL